MGQIFGIGGYTRLAAGYPVNINDMNIRTATISKEQEDGILPGQLVIATDVYNSVITTDSVAEVADYTNKVLGIAVATNVKLDPCFPQSKTGTTWLPGEALGYAVTGEIAVQFTGSAPVQNQPAYYDIANGVFTTESSDTLALPNMVFSGITQGTLTVVKILY